MADDEQMKTIEEALLALAGEKRFADIRPSDIAARAGIDLADLRRSFDGPFDILESFARRIDIGVLAGGDPELAGEPARERLRDVLMRRFDLLAPYRAGLAGLDRAARTDPLLACRLARISVGSQNWMLEAAGVSTVGLTGRLRAPALAVSLGCLLSTFLDDAEPGLPKTMAALDKALDRLERIDARVRWFEDLATRACDRARRPSAAARETAFDPSI
ncbi:TetR/AcrR family transcriptional regulator [Siculibacillus lacustris]|uniref:TetR/AcrR family transcriptional regulator n=1 Tax=Siculibacillus lacustris TaxID=1549641 RepID=A0A4Q9VID2_9HYPH|nr:TetR/AcrR family transcriptional regulator [Siculibacillus lacustris]TBW34736.1 TetR/AcrR family transcriptional regulator [Siculibacillus lacustris]